MTDEQIVKALECCTRGKICRECPLKTEDRCMSIIRGDALDLINRQKAEIERLTKRIKSQKHALFEQQSYTSELQTEIDNLQHYKQSYDELKAEHLELIRSIKTCQIEVIKEFAERYRKRISFFVPIAKFEEQGGIYACLDKLDEVEKEMVGDSDA